MKTACPHCGQHYDVEDQYNGQTFPCPQCGKEFTLVPMQESKPATKDPGIILQASPVYIILRDPFFILTVAFDFIIVREVYRPLDEVAIWIHVALAAFAGVTVGISILLGHYVTKKTVYTLHADKLEIVSGFIEREFRTIRFEDVRDIQVTQDAIQSALDCGTLCCYNKGIDIPFSLEDIPEPMRWKEEIEKRIR